MPLQPLERLHAFVCMQVGACFSDVWEISNRAQVSVAAAAAVLPSGGEQSNGGLWALPPAGHCRPPVYAHSSRDLPRPLRLLSRRTRSMASAPRPPAPWACWCPPPPPRLPRRWRCSARRGGCRKSWRPRACQRCVPLAANASAACALSRPPAFAQVSLTPLFSGLPAGRRPRAPVSLVCPVGRQRQARCHSSGGHLGAGRQQQRRRRQRARQQRRRQAGQGQAWQRWRRRGGGAPAGAAAWLGPGPDHAAGGGRARAVAHADGRRRGEPGSAAGLA